MIFHEEDSQNDGFIVSIEEEFFASIWQVTCEKRQLFCREVRFFLLQHYDLGWGGCRLDIGHDALAETNGVGS